MRTLVVGAVVLAVGVGAGIAGSLMVRSPGSDALEKAAPTLPPATAPVERGLLGESLVVEAKVASSGDVLVPGADLGGIVTRVPELGRDVSPGTVVLEVSGRPIVVLSGDNVVYRDFVGGSQGNDVWTLQHGLNSLGFAAGPTDGLYGPSTAAAVEALYGSIGYVPPASSASPAEVAVARTEVSAAVAALKKIEHDAVVFAGDGDPLTFVDPADIAVSAASLAVARESLKKTRDASLTPLPADEVFFMTGFAYELIDSEATVGLPAASGLRILSTGTSRALWATVPRSVAARLSVGTPAAISLVTPEETGDGVDELVGTVTWVADAAGHDGVADRFGNAFVVPAGEVNRLRFCAAPMRVSSPVGMTR